MVNELLDKQLVARKDGAELDTFAITEKGADGLVVHQTSTFHCLLSRFSSADAQGSGVDALDLAHCTDFDLVLALGQGGWQVRQEKPSRKTIPYKPGAEKVWYYHRSTAKGGITRKYLTALLQVEKLFAKGVKELFHFQPGGYYAAILQDNDPGKVLPWQSKEYYKVLLQRSRPAKRARAKASGLMEDHSVVDFNPAADVEGSAVTARPSIVEEAASKPSGSGRPSSSSSESDSSEDSLLVELQMTKNMQGGQGGDEHDKAAEASHSAAPSASRSSKSSNRQDVQPRARRTAAVRGLRERRQGEQATMWSPNTVWVSSIAFIERTDQSATCHTNFSRVGQWVRVSPFCLLCHL